LLSAVAAVTALLGLLGRLTLFVEDVCVWDWTSAAAIWRKGHWTLVHPRRVLKYLHRGRSFVSIRTAGPPCFMLNSWFSAVDQWRIHDGREEWKNDNCG
jgi:hypothetical protein